MTKEEMFAILDTIPTIGEQVDALEMAISMLKNNDWIPVSERLPEERYAVLVWCPERKNTYCAYLEERQWWIFGAYFEKVKLEVIAWMPLPEPYKGNNNLCDTNPFGDSRFSG